MGSLLRMATAYRHLKEALRRRLELVLEAWGLARLRRYDPVTYRELRAIVRIAQQAMSGYR